MRKLKKLRSWKKAPQVRLMKSLLNPMRLSVVEPSVVGPSVVGPSVEGPSVVEVSVVEVSVDVGAIAAHEVTRRRMMGLLKRLSISIAPVRW
jgi:hypothetical protein